jgi:hypothetical protein
VAAFSVEHVVLNSGTRAIPRDAYVYIRQANPRAGIFRCDPTGGSVVQLVGAGAGTWVPVAGRLSVDPGQTYYGFCLDRGGASNLPTSVLQQALAALPQYGLNAAPSGPYVLTVNADDARARRIRVSYYQRVQVQAVEVVGPIWHLPGQDQPPPDGFTRQGVNYYLKARWETSATSGYLIQEIDVWMNVTDAAGRPVNADQAHYWEAWRIKGLNLFDANPFDCWSINISAQTQGTWRKTGTVFWVPALLPEWNFHRGQVRNAGKLISTGVPPQHLGSPLFTRTRAGQWNGCAGHPALYTHGETA